MVEDYPDELWPLLIELDDGWLVKWVTDERAPEGQALIKRNVSDWRGNSVTTHAALRPYSAKRGEIARNGNASEMGGRENRANRPDNPHKIRPQ